VIVAPPVVRKLLLASLAVTVAVTVLPETTVAADTLSTELAATAGPGMKLTVPPEREAGVSKVKVLVSAFVEASVQVDTPLALLVMHVAVEMLPVPLALKVGTTLG